MAIRHYFGRNLTTLILLLILLLVLSACNSTLPHAAVTDQPITQDRATRRLAPGELLLAADDDAIPALFLDDTVFVSAQDGSREWRDDDLVIGVAINGDARAYPIRLLSLHEIANDTIGGQPVAVTWCPLCFTAIVFDRVVTTHNTPRELTFGVSGFLYRNNLVMYDHQTNTLWSQLLGEGLRGAQSGTQLDFYSSSLNRWGEWKTAYPQTRIISAEKLGLRAADIVDPYSSYYVGGAAGFDTGAERNETLSAKQLVTGLVLNDQARAYDLQAIAAENVINDTLDAIPIVVFYDSGFQSAHAYSRLVDDRMLSFERTDDATVVRDRETNSKWEIRTGIAQSGPLAGQRLSRLSAPLVFWFAWTDIYPHTDVYGMPIATGG
ncbi:MAG: DUF3179 domain-containing protein [Anaerolineae bacterium]|nr:DUF3179 domain-containing protein [Anaerolineae bacterium]